MNAKLILVILLASLFIVFMLQNEDPLRVRFLPWSAVVSKSLLILLVFVAGLIFGWISFAWGRRKRDPTPEKKRKSR